MNSLVAPVVACAALITVGCTENDRPAPALEPKRMTNGVPLALDNELQNRKDGKWYWRDTTNLFTGIEVLHHTNGVLKLQLPFTWPGTITVRIGNRTSSTCRGSRLK